MTRICSALIASALVYFAPEPALAADILFVSNSGADTNIATVLRADGHTVTMASDSALAGDLSAYGAVFWSASTISISSLASLTTYVMSGGRVFVTGYDALRRSDLITQFCGGTGSRDLVGSPSSEAGPITTEANSLNTGVIDIRGLTPTGGHTDKDGLTGLLPDTREVAPSAAGGSSQWTLRALGDGEIAWVSNGMSSGSHSSWESTATGGAGAYNAAVRNFAFAADFATADPGAPEITFDAPFTVNEGQSVTLSVSIADAEGDSFSYSWDLDGDESFGENADTASYTIEADTTDGPAGMRIGVEAVDAHGNTSYRYRTLRVLNVAPRITSEPPLVTSVGASFRYALTVVDPGGAHDPLTFTMLRGPERMVVSPEGIVQWTPTESDVTRAGETLRVEVQVDDGDGGLDVQGWELTVSPNRVPTPPAPAYPVDRIAIVNTTPRLVVANAEDLDLDPLTYVFEIDRVDTFDSPALRTSEPIEETPGITAWQLTEPLEENRLYHWRVYASDGMAESEVRQAAFYVVRDPSLGPPDAGASPMILDGGLISGRDAGPGGSGGGCSIGSRGAGPLAPLGLFVALGLVLARRRRIRRAGE